MVKYFIYAILLKDCPYSNKAQQLLTNNKINHVIKNVNFKDKEKFKMENYNTYPQIFLKKDNSNESLFLGGYSDLHDFIKNFYDNNIDIEKFQNKYKWWSKKAVLRLIELIKN